MTTEIFEILAGNPDLVFGIKGIKGDCTKIRMLLKRGAGPTTEVDLYSFACSPELLNYNFQNLLKQA